MSPQFSKTELDLINLVNDTQSFEFDGVMHNVIKACKPTVSRGECKTDLYIKTDKRDFKISVKQLNADFLENKVSYDRAIQIFGDSASDVIIKSIEKIKESFINHPLICFERLGRTEEKTIVMGWKFELLNKLSGQKSALMELTEDQKLNVYSGHLLADDKRNALVDGNIVINSGVAEFILEVDYVKSKNLQHYIERLICISEFSKKQDIYFACKALNYRALKDKWDGDRPLAVYVDWFLDCKELKGVINYKDPLTKKGNSIGNNIRNILKKLEINKENFDNLKKYYKGISHP